MSINWYCWIKFFSFYCIVFIGYSMVDYLISSVSSIGYFTCSSIENAIYNVSFKSLLTIIISMIRSIPKSIIWRSCLWNLIRVSMCILTKISGLCNVSWGKSKLDRFNKSYDFKSNHDLSFIWYRCIPKYRIPRGSSSSANVSILFYNNRSISKFLTKLKLMSDISTKNFKR